MHIPTADEWKRAADVIGARGPFAPETAELAWAGLRDPSVKAVLDRQVDVASQMLGVENNIDLRAVLMGVLMAGLNLGLTVRDGE